MPLKAGKFIQKPLDKTKCGQPSNYRAHLRRGEKACFKCRVAEANMKLVCFVKGDTRIHVEYDDDGWPTRASLLTNPQHGFRRFIKSLTVHELSSLLATGFEKTFEREL